MYKFVKINVKLLEEVKLKVSSEFGIVLNNQKSIERALMKYLEKGDKKK